MPRTDREERKWNTPTPMNRISEILRCPRCKSPVDIDISDKQPRVRCRNTHCKHNGFPFPDFSGQPALIDFETSVVSEQELLAREGSARPRGTGMLTTIARTLQKRLLGANRSAARLCAKFLSQVRGRTASPRVLIIGGGVVGSGSESLYAADDIELVGTDIYSSRYTSLLSDGHNLPFVDGAFDGVWIQAVLEHVVEPSLVVSEIHRVLKDGGVVFAETPFMQQVHGGAYDFCRFSLSGHRWLFREFSLISGGVSQGPGTAFFWSIRYLLRALTRSERVAFALSLFFFWTRFLDRFGTPQARADGACGIYFLGKRSLTSLQHKDIIRYYEETVGVR